MNIAFMIRNIDPTSGGTERVTFSIINKLQLLKYTCFYIFLDKDYDKIDNAKKLNIGCKNNREKEECLFNFIKENNIKVLIIVNQIFQTKDYQRIFLRLKSNIDFKIIASLHAAPDNWIFKDKWGLVTPKIFCKDLLKACLYKLYNPYKVRAIGMYNIADKYLLLSEAYIKVFKNVMNINDISNKLIAITNPFPFQHESCNFNKENIVLIVARMDEYQKRIYIALKMWKQIEKKYPNWKLCIVGGGKDLSSYKNYAKKFKLKNITFEGHSNNVSYYYLKSKIFWMTSIWEGLPMTLIEAQQYGCICIAFNSFASITDVIQNNKNGYIIPNNNTQEFIKKTEFLIKNDLVTNNIIKSLNDNHNPKFTIDNIIKNWDKLLQSLNT